MTAFYLFVPILSGIYLTSVVQSLASLSDWEHPHLRAFGNTVTLRCALFYVAKLYKICRTLMSQLSTNMFNKDTAGKKGQLCRYMGQINVYTYLVMSIHFCTFVVEKEIYRTFRSCARHEPSAYNYDKSNKHHLR